MSDRARRQARGAWRGRAAASAPPAPSRCAEAGAARRRRSSAARTERLARRPRQPVADAGAEATATACDRHQHRRDRADGSQAIGPHDVLVHSAGTQPAGAVRRRDARDASTSCSTLNVRGAFFTAQAAARQLRPRRRDRLHLLADGPRRRRRLRTRLLRDASTPSKGSSKALAVELRRARHPRRVRRTHVRGDRDDARPARGPGDRARRCSRRSRQGRFGTLEEVAAAVVFAASPAAGMVTGCEHRRSTEVGPPDDPTADRSPHRRAGARALAAGPAQRARRRACAARCPRHLGHLRPRQRARARRRRVEQEGAELPLLPAQARAGDGARGARLREGERAGWPRSPAPPRSAPARRTCSPARPPRPSNRLPVLLLPSDTFATRRQGPVLQQLEHPVDADVTVNDAFRPLQPLLRPHRAPGAAADRAARRRCACCSTPRRPAR